MPHRGRGKIDLLNEDNTEVYRQIDSYEGNSHATPLKGEDLLRLTPRGVLCTIIVEGGSGKSSRVRPFRVQVSYEKPETVKADEDLNQCTDYGEGQKPTEPCHHRGRMVGNADVSDTVRHSSNR